MIAKGLLWHYFELGGERTTIPAVRLRLLRTLAGGVYDRQGRPVGGARVFLPAGGPSNVTDAKGRFTLRGVLPGKTFVLAQQPGFRFQGWPVDPATQARDLRLTLVRMSESPDRAMTALDEPIPLDQARALASRVLEPCLQDVPENGRANDNKEALAALSTFDLDRALKLFKKGLVADQRSANLLRVELARRLAEQDAAGAEALIEKITDSALRAEGLLTLAKAIPASRRDQRRRLLERVVPVVRGMPDTSEKIPPIADIAEAWLELGEAEKARNVLNEGLKFYDAVPNPRIAHEQRDRRWRIHVKRHRGQGLPRPTGRGCSTGRNGGTARNIGYVVVLARPVSSSPRRWVSRPKNGGNPAGGTSPRSFRSTIDATQFSRWSRSFKAVQPSSRAWSIAATSRSTRAEVRAISQRVINARICKFIPISKSRSDGCLKRSDRSVGIRARKFLELSRRRAVIVTAQRDASAQESGRLVRFLESARLDRLKSRDGRGSGSMVLLVELERAEAPVRVAGRLSMKCVKQVLAMDGGEQGGGLARERQGFRTSPTLAQQLCQVMQLPGRGQTGTRGRRDVRSAASTGMRLPFARTARPRRTHWRSGTLPPVCRSSWRVFQRRRAQRASGPRATSRIATARTSSSRPCPRLLASPPITAAWRSMSVARRSW